MPEHVLPVRFYVIIGVALWVLTILSVGLSFIELDTWYHVIIGEGIGCIKASLVVLFFMHAVESPRITWIVIVVSIGWLGIMLVLSFCDYMTRGLLPFVPGH